MTAEAVCNRYIRVPRKSYFMDTPARMTRAHPSCLCASDTRSDQHASAPMLLGRKNVSKPMCYRGVGLTVFSTTAVDTVLVLRELTSLTVAGSCW